VVVILSRIGTARGRPACNTHQQTGPEGHALIATGLPRIALLTGNQSPTSASGALLGVALLGVALLGMALSSACVDVAPAHVP
jgi:hypothetical protein